MGPPRVYSLFSVFFAYKMQTDPDDAYDLIIFFIHHVSRIPAAIETTPELWLTRLRLALVPRRPDPSGFAPTPAATRRAEPSRRTRPFRTD